MKYTIPIGTSEPQDFVLKDAGVVINGTGISVALKIEQSVPPAGSVPVASPPVVAWLDQPNGKVRVTGVETLPLGSYLVRFQLTDGAGKLGFVPNGEKADVWHVVPVASY